MAKRILFIAACTAIVLISSCKREDFASTRPAYLSIPAMELTTNSISTEGSAHSEITTVWIMINGQAAGAFELPCTVPIIAEGNAEVEIYPGITMNGMSSSRAIYEPFEKIETTVNFTALDTSYLNGKGNPVEVHYAGDANITIMEDFDRSGLNMTATAGSDTNILKVADSSEVFHWPGEDNGRAGKIVLSGDRGFFEVSSVESYTLPSSGRSVYLEMTYRNNMPFYVGIIAKSASGNDDAQVEVLYVYNSEEWNKLYINLVTELTYYSGATSYQIFMGGFKPDGLDTGKIYLDNLKLVY